MSDFIQEVQELRAMSEAELTQLGEDSLLNHLRHQAFQARERHGGLRPGNLDAFLEDRECVRYPTRLALEYGGMGPHQFAHPDRDLQSEDQSARVLFLRPVLGKRPDYIALALSYMLPVINFGDIVDDEHCIEYGAALMGMDPEEYYDQICEIADFVGAESRLADEVFDPLPEDTGGCGCGGCSCH